MKKQLYLFLAMLQFIAFSATAFASSSVIHAGNHNAPVLRKEMPLKPAIRIEKTESAAATIQSGSLEKAESAKPALSKKEMRQHARELRSDLKNAIKSAPKGDMQVICIILCFFIPPLAVYLYEDAITTNFWIDLILTLLFWLPGVIFALLVCLDVI